MSFTKADIKILEKMFKNSESRIEKNIEKKFEESFSNMLDERLIKLESELMEKVNIVIDQKNGELIQKNFKYFVTQYEVKTMIDESMKQQYDIISQNTANIAKHDYIFQVSGLKDQYKLS